MATGDYATLAEVRTHLGIDSTDTTRDALILELITSVSRAIDRYCCRQFYATTETRYYDYQSPWKLWLDKDLYSITTVTNGNGNTLTLNTDFYALPYDGPPFRWLEIKRDSGSLFQYSGTTQRAITITGKWGYSETTPEPVKRACILWVADYLTRQGDEGIAEITIDGGEMRTRYEATSPGSPPPLVAVLLQAYRPVEVG